MFLGDAEFITGQMLGIFGAPVVFGFDKYFRRKNAIARKARDAQTGADLSRP